MSVARVTSLPVVPGARVERSNLMNAVRTLFLAGGPWMRRVFTAPNVPREPAVVWASASGMASTADASLGLRKQAPTNASTKARATFSRPVPCLILLYLLHQRRPNGRPYPDREARQPPASVALSNEHPFSNPHVACSVKHEGHGPRRT